VKARAAAQAGAHHLGANGNDEKGAEAATKARFGKPQKRDFNQWMEDNDDDEKEEEEEEEEKE